MGSPGVEEKVLLSGWAAVHAGRKTRQHVMSTGTATPGLEPQLGHLLMRSFTDGDKLLKAHCRRVFQFQSKDNNTALSWACFMDEMTEKNDSVLCPGT
jgi:hypothetical protein